MDKYPFDSKLAAEGRGVRKVKVDGAEGHKPQPKNRENSYKPAPADLMSRYSAANNRHFGANLAFAFARVSK